MTKVIDENKLDDDAVNYISDPDIERTDYYASMIDFKAGYRKAMEE